MSTTLDVLHKNIANHKAHILVLSSDPKERPMIHNVDLLIENI